MKKIITLLFFTSLHFTIWAVKVSFTAANMSVNVAEGTISIFTSFKLFPDDFENTDSLNAIDFVDFHFVSYNDIAEVMIDKAMLSGGSSPSFLRMVNFVITDSLSNGNRTDSDILQGATYVFRLTVKNKNGQEFQLMNRELTTQLADPTINCAKLNEIYRLAGHNTYQTSVASSLYFSMFYTRVLELDVHSSNNPTTWNWNVRHAGSGNNNNCRSGNEPFGICIDEIKRWHNNHPNHDVIILFIDLKSKWAEKDPNQTPSDLDQRLLSLVPNADDIYKPRDLIGNNFSDMRTAAQQNNWPSMGDLTGKLIFVLTGDGDKVSKYIADRSLDAVAFSAAGVENVSDVVNVAGIWPGLKNDIVFYNNNLDKINNHAGGFASARRYITRIWDSNFIGAPLGFSNNEYEQSIDEGIHNIAVKDIDGNYNPGGKPVNGIQRIPQTLNPLLNNDHIYSNYQNVTQAGVQTITATNLIVEPGTHYRMIAGNSIDLQPGVDIKQGSDVDIRIDDCRYTDYTQRQNTQKGEQLTQEEIDKIMHQLNKELYGYQPESEKEVVNLAVFPNPTNNIINISYTNFLIAPSTFTLFDITGRVVKTKKYTPQSEGKQQFSLTINELNEGTYFYTLQVGEQSYNGKVIKME